MNWREEFGDAYDIPQWFDDHPDLQDTSWHNDTSPSFETGVDHPDYPENARVRIWAEHHDTEERETSGSHRYFIQFIGERDDSNGGYRYCDDVWLGETDDLAIVDCMLRWGQNLIRQHGIPMCPSRDGSGDLGIFPAEQQYLFDASGKPNFPGLPPLPSPCEIPTPRRGVEDALDAVNRQRARFGQPPLDPESAGWTEEDILDEAARIRLKNRLTAL